MNINNIGEKLLSDNDRNSLEKKPIIISPLETEDLSSLTIVEDTISISNLQFITQVRYFISLILYVFSYTITIGQIQSYSMVKQEGLQYKDKFFIVYFIFYRSIASIITSCLIFKFSNIQLPKIKELKYRRWLLSKSILFFISLLCLIKMFKYLRFITVILFNLALYPVLTEFVSIIASKENLTLKLMKNFIAFLSTLGCLLINEQKSQFIKPDHDNYSLNLSEKKPYYIHSYCIDVYIGISYGITYNVLFYFFLQIENKVSKLDSDIKIFYDSIGSFVYGLVYIIYTNQYVLIFLNGWIMLGSVANGVLIYFSNILSRRKIKFCERNTMLFNLFGCQLFAYLLSIYYLGERFTYADFFGAIVIQFVMIILLISQEMKENQESKEFKSNSRE